MRMLRLGMILMGAMIVAATLPLIGVRRASSPVSWIVYQDNSSDDPVLRVMHHDGSAQQSIDALIEKPLPPASYFVPRWSWVDNSILVAVIIEYPTQLYRLQIPQGHFEKISHQDWVHTFPSAGPDRDFIVYQVYDDDNREHIYRMLRNGQEPTKLFEDAYHPSLSPDGEWIAFISQGEASNGLWRMRPDGSHAEQLTNGNLQINHFASRDGHPTWSPDSEWIVFSAGWNLYRIRADGSAMFQITDGGQDDIAPVWSPDGEWIAFARSENGSYDIYRIRPDGSQLEQLTDDPRDQLNPSYGPTIDLPFAGGWLVVLGSAVMLGPIAVRLRRA